MRRSQSLEKLLAEEEPACGGAVSANRAKYMGDMTREFLEAEMAFYQFRFGPLTPLEEAALMDIHDPTADDRYLCDKRLISARIAELGRIPLKVPKLYFACLRKPVKDLLRRSDGYVEQFQRRRFFARRKALWTCRHPCYIDNPLRGSVIAPCFPLPEVDIEAAKAKKRLKSKAIGFATVDAVPQRASKAAAQMEKTMVQREAARFRRRRAKLRSMSLRGIRTDGRRLGDRSSRSKRRRGGGGAFRGVDQGLGTSSHASGEFPARVLEDKEREGLDHAAGMDGIFRKASGVKAIEGDLGVAARDWSDAEEGGEGGGDADHKQQQQSSSSARSRASSSSGPARADASNLQVVVRGVGRASASSKTTDGGVVDLRSSYDTMPGRAPGSDIAPAATDALDRTHRHGMASPVRRRSVQSNESGTHPAVVGLELSNIFAGPGSGPPSLDSRDTGNNNPGANHSSRPGLDFIPMQVAPGAAHTTGTEAGGILSRPRGRSRSAWDRWQPGQFGSPSATSPLPPDAVMQSLQGHPLVRVPSDVSRNSRDATGNRQPPRGIAANASASSSDLGLQLTGEHTG